MEPSPREGESATTGKMGLVKQRPTKPAFFFVVLRKILQFHCWMDGRRTEFGLAGSTGMGPADRNLDDTKISLGCLKET